MRTILKKEANSPEMTDVDVLVWEYERSLERNARKHRFFWCVVWAVISGLTVWSVF